MKGKEKYVRITNNLIKRKEKKRSTVNEQTEN